MRALGSAAAKKAQEMFRNRPLMGLLSTTGKPVKDQAKHEIRPSKVL